MEIETSIITFLRSVKLFSNLTEEELEVVAGICHKEYFAKGDPLFLQSEKLENVYIIAQGRVRLYGMSETGMEQTFQLIDRGEMCPHVGFFRSGNYPHHAMAAMLVQCIVIKVKDFEQLLLTYPDISLKMMQLLADKIIDLQHRLEVKTFYPIEVQFISLLLRLSEVHSEQLDDQWRQFTTMFTNAELAGMLGSTRETINRVINKLKKQQIVHINNSGLLQIQTEGLRSMLSPALIKSMDQPKKYVVSSLAKVCCTRGGHEV
jgi:CRP/FNR family transcriptional regulator